MSRQPVPDPNRRRLIAALIEEALAGIADALQALNRELRAPAGREKRLAQVEEKLEELESEAQARLAGIEGEIGEIQAQSVRDREELLAKLQRIEQGIADLSRSQDRRVLERLKVLIVVLAGATGSALYQAMIQEDVYPQLKARLLELEKQIGEALQRLEQPAAALEPAPTPAPTSIPATALEPELIFIPAGRFIMGEGSEEHEVYVGDFYIARYPVTNAQYQRFVDATGHRVPFAKWAESYSWNRLLRTYPLGQADHPVVLVSWHDAVAYCRWLSQATGKPYRLPTEAEWEKAARGGLFLDGDASAQVRNPNPRRIYPWGDTFDKERCNSAGSGIDHTTPVGRYPTGASPYGVMDMAGNVWEWTGSLHKPYPYDPGDNRENLKAEGGRVLRGGAFYNNERYVRCASRYWLYPDSRRDDVGLRVASPSL